MSPLIFLLIMEGLDRIIPKDKHDGYIKGIKIARHPSISHHLFVGDVVLFGNRSLEEWRFYKHILDIFCDGIGMPINESKSIFLEYGMEYTVTDQMKAIFLYSFQELDQGFKYLCFQLKPNNYKNQTGPNYSRKLK